MFPILERKELNEQVFSLTIHAPRVAKNAMPGQFLIVKTDEKAERIPLTIADYDREQQTVCVVVQKIGVSTKKLAEYQAGESLYDVVGPLGHPSEWMKEPKTPSEKQQFVFIGGGLGIAPIYPQVKWLFEHGIRVDVIMGARTKSLLFWEEKMRRVAGTVYCVTDDGSYGQPGRVTDALRFLVEEQKKHYDRVVVIGPMIMMKFVCELTAPSGLNIPTTVSMNPIMVDGTGMCGACRVSVDGKVKFACVDGPEFDGHKIDFDQALRRLQLYKTPLGRAQLEKEEGEPLHTGDCSKKILTPDPWKRVAIREQNPKERATNFREVCLGYTKEEAMAEATRCLQCKKPKCVSHCPVSIAIPDFIHAIAEGNFQESFEILEQSTNLAAVCGRVCPQEEQCEGACVRKAKGDPVAIGKLERFAADWARENNTYLPFAEKEKQGYRVAIVGSGPAGLTCAGDLAKLGYEVTIFESLHLPGGVLQYGIPEFRLPKEDVVAHEVASVLRSGVQLETNVFVGRSVTLHQLEEEGFDAIFLASGAGLPKFMGIPGEQANGVLSANEYLTKVNLMRAYDDTYDTKLPQAQRVVVVGGGNVAMDAARTALRLGAETYIVYRRGEEELPARKEEVEHAKEEGVIFKLLQTPTEIYVDDKGWVSAIRCIQMRLGEPDASGRRRPEPIKGSDFVLGCDLVILALGTNANPVALEGYPEIKRNARNGIQINEETCQTSVPHIFAGGDAVTGSATVILAMGAGKKAARGIHQYLQKRKMQNSDSK